MTRTSASVLLVVQSLALQTKRIGKTAKSPFWLSRIAKISVEIPPDLSQSGLSTSSVPITVPGISGSGRRNDELPRSPSARALNARLGP